MRPRRGRWALLTVAVATLSLADASRPPEQQLNVAGAHAGIWMYQHTLSIAIQAFGISCRFTPTCSRYAHAALSGYGWLRGTQLAAYRLARCGPWTPRGTVEPLPGIS